MYFIIIYVPHCVNSIHREESSFSEICQCQCALWIISLLRYCSWLLRFSNEMFWAPQNKFHPPPLYWGGGGHLRDMYHKTWRKKTKATVWLDPTRGKKIFLLFGWTDPLMNQSILPIWNQIPSKPNSPNPTLCATVRRVEGGNVANLMSLKQGVAYKNNSWINKS